MDGALIYDAAACQLPSQGNDGKTNRPSWRSTRVARNRCTPGPPGQILTSWGHLFTGRDGGDAAEVSVFDAVTVSLDREGVRQ